MSNTAARPGPFDPTADCMPDEPYFPLVGRDPDAPAAINFWADHRRKRLTRELVSRKAPSPERMAEIQEDLQRCTEADEIAADMVRWKKGQPEHNTSPGRVNYSGNEADADQVTEAAQRSSVAAQVQNLREAAYFASEARDHLGSMAVLDPLQQVQLEEALRLINAVADAHEPKRPGYIPPLPLEQPV